MNTNMNKDTKQALKHIVEMQARRRGISEQEIQRAKETVARHESQCAEDVAESDLKSLLESRYPTAQCVMPYEIEQYEQFSLLPEQRREHVHGCPFCSVLFALYVR